MEDEVLTKSDVRGRRSQKSKTEKRPSHYFDDEKQVKGGRRGHSRMQDQDQDDEFLYDDLDEFDPSIDWKKLLK